MPRKKSPVKDAPLALGADGMTVTVPVRPLVYEERLKLQQILNEPVFVQAWQNAQACRPSVMPLGLDTALGPQIGNNRLHQMQGWDMFRVAILKQVLDPVAARPKIADNYPDSGLREAELKARAGHTITTTISP